VQKFVQKIKIDLDRNVILEPDNDDDVNSPAS